MHGYQISINTTSKKEYDTEFSISRIAPPKASASLSQFNH